MDVSKVLSKHSVDSGTPVFAATFDTPVGNATGIADNKHLFMLSFEDSKNIDKMVQVIAKELSCRFVEEKNNVLQLLEKELASYFQGKLLKFTVPIKTIGSEFQKQVWNKLLELPYGSTQTYGDLATSLGWSTSHARAIGAACGANAHLLVIPCHRLVASGGKGGFSCGVGRKAWLLEHEKKLSSKYSLNPLIHFGKI